MARCRCDWDKFSESAESIITPLTDLECALIDSAFTPFLLVNKINRKFRRVHCTACDSEFEHERGTVPNGLPDLSFDAWAGVWKHGDHLNCPNCGRVCRVIYEGYMRGGHSRKLDEKGNFVVFHAERDGWLSAIAVTAEKQYFNRNWYVFPSIYVRAVYLFKSGIALQWRINSYSGKESRAVNITEAFHSNIREAWLGNDNFQYSVIGIETIYDTDMRYCGIGDLSTEYRYKLIIFLGEYTHRPQLEMILKFNISFLLSGLLKERVTLSHLVDWKAKNPQEFLGLDKPRMKLFLNKTKKSMWDLVVLRNLENLSDFERCLKVGERLRFDVLRVSKFSRKYGFSFKKTLLYLEKNDVSLWLDYIGFAENCGYDLRERTVFLPKNLLERHDTACANSKIIVAERRDKAYSKRAAKLQRKFEYADEKFCILVPKVLDEIVEEGKILHHCVGHYCDQHASGKTNILFLRKTEEQNIPYGTIEFKRNEIVQLRGYRNNDVPQLESKEFIDKWLSWLRAGSPRDAEGKPVKVIEIQEGA